ncbi:MAG TPA: helix-turn-helix domain-containing protein [Polyangiaceae bacterium]|jgi:flagellar biosynthesis protein FlhG|nr:helix-turn-helix domain-containing protein [Polyangiaceae bacterium]
MSDVTAPSYPPDSSQGIAPPPGVRRTIAVGGGRGGVGKSVLAVNLGVYVAQLGRKVLLIDADPAGAALHTVLGIEPPNLPEPSEDSEEDDLVPLPTQVPGLQLVAQGYRVGSTVPVRPGRKPRWARQVQKLDIDYVILDLGAGTGPATLDLFLSADIGICVSAPEPPAIEATYRFTRALFQRMMRRLLSKDRFKMRLLERAEAELGPLPPPQDLVRAVARYDSNLGELAAAELVKLRPRLVVNSGRLRGDTELGPAMCDMAERYLGVHFDYVGHIEQDDAVWLSVTHRRPLLIDSPTSKSARNVERIARRVLALSTTREQQQQVPTLSLVPGEPNLYDVLWTHQSASDEDLRRAYKRQRELYQPGSLPLTSLLKGDQLRTEQARVEEAHDTLLDPLRRKAYDASVFPAERAELPPRNAALDSALEAERSMLQKELAREINGETEFTGTLLRKIRESHGIELSEIAKLTKISSTHLQAIEAEKFADLPALVYTRGFVQQLAKFLKLDPTQVPKTYLRRLRDWRALSDGDPEP